MAEISIRQLAKIIAGAIVAALIFFFLGLVSGPIMDFIVDSKTISAMMAFINVPKRAINSGSANAYYMSIEASRTSLVVGTICKNDSYQSYIEEWSDKKFPESKKDYYQSLCKKGYCFCILKLTPSKGINWEEVKPFVKGDDYDSGLLNEIDEANVKSIKVLSCTEWPSTPQGEPYKLVMNDLECGTTEKRNWLLCLLNLVVCVLYTESDYECSQTGEDTFVVGIIPYTYEKSSFAGSTHVTLKPLEIQDVYAEAEEDKVYLEITPDYPMMDQVELLMVIE